MNPVNINYSKVNGKTFSLFDQSDSAAQYYKTIRSLADICVKKSGNEVSLLKRVHNLSRKKSQLKKLFLSKDDANFNTSLLKLLYPELHPYTVEVNNHLKNLSILKKKRVSKMKILGKSKL